MKANVEATCCRHSLTKASTVAFASDLCVRKDPIVLESLNPCRG
jgi:hypothetical protein